MKRYALFQGAIYYPGGGWEDFIESFDDAFDANRKAISDLSEGNWFQIVDLRTGKTVLEDTKDWGE